MKPYIFMDDFERTEWGDAHYAAVGRLLTVACRFESITKSISMLLGLKDNPSLLDSEAQLSKFHSRLRRQPLANHLADLGLDQDEVGNILRKATSARNEIAHELTLGMDQCLDSVIARRKTLMDEVRDHAIALAEGDRLVSYLMSALTHEHLPGRDFFLEYPERVAAWVSEL